MMNKVYLQSGEVYVASEPAQIVTVLGSCVAVCLYDAKRRIGGMNHYLLPLWNDQGLQSPRYGNIAIERLIEAMLSQGCERRNMVAKFFGGSQMYRESIKSLMVGNKNIVVARELLQASAIPVIAEDVGGYQGRKIIFDTSSGKVLMKYLQRRNDD